MSQRPKTSGQQKRVERVSIFTPEFREDLGFFVERDRKLALRVLDLVEDVMRDPFAGIGKPEPLKFWRSDAWSRRVNDEHRVVYLVESDRISFLQCRYHY